MSSGTPGTISKVTVTLNLLTHTFARDLDIILVGPLGQRSILMSDAGNGAPGPSGQSITFDQTAANAIAESTVPTTGPVRPANYDITNDTFTPGPGSLPSTEPANLNVFNGTNPDGAWSLYVVDDATGDSGNIGLGWTLNITNPVVTVNNTTDENDGKCVIDCSLREAIATAVAGDTITFAAGFNGQTISQTLGQIVINKNLTITGPGANLLTISGSSNGPNRLFDVSGSSVFNLS